MKQGKEVKPVEVPAYDPDLAEVDFHEGFNNRLRLEDGIKNYLRSKGLDWRFISAQQFANDGNSDMGYWKPYDFRECEASARRRSADGFIRVGDLILAVRSTKITQKYKEHIARRTAIQSGEYQKAHADELRRTLAGVKGTKVHTGYEENE